MSDYIIDLITYPCSNLRETNVINSSDAGDGYSIFWGSIPRLLMSWLLKSSRHQQIWYWLCRTTCTFAELISSTWVQIQDTVECRYNRVQNNMIMHTSLQWPRQNINQSLHSQKTPHLSPSQVSYRVSLVRILENIDHVMTDHTVQFKMWIYVF